MTRTTNKNLTLTGAVSFLALTFAVGNAYAQETDFDIDAQPLAKALLDFNEQSGLTVAAPRDLVEGKSAPAVRGEMEPEEALEKILSGSGLRSNELPTGAYTITLASAEVTEPAPQPFRVAQLDQEDDIRDVTSDIEDVERIEDVIIVTGTNIRRATNQPSPVTVFTREEIDAAGFTTTTELVRSLPQNLDTSENAANGIAGVTDVLAGSSSANLRGLGTGSTLVLVNGRRVAPESGVETVNLALIPLSAVERVEVLTDGASAIYGSDAIAGVINFILRDDFDGAETRLRFGGVTQGSSQEYQASQTFGRSWSTGNLVANYEYRRTNNLDSQSRSFTEQVDDPTDLIPKTERHNVFMTGRQSLNESLAVFIDASYAKSDVESTTTQALGATLDSRLTIINSEQYGGTIGVDAEFGGNWTGQVYGSVSVGDQRGQIVANGIDASENETELTYWTGEAKLTGPILSLPGGDVQLAIGGQYRSEGLEQTTSSSGLPGSSLNISRDLYAAYAEVFVPVVGEVNRRQGLYAFEVTAAGRFEDYSNTGSSFDPKFGVRYAPTPDLSLRGTYSTSFRAPTFFNLSSPGIANALPGALFAPPQDGSVVPDTILLGGGNPDLQPEESRTFTAGFDYRAPVKDTLTFSASYFDIVFDQRIGNPINGDVFSAFAVPGVLGGFLDTNPTQDEIDSIFASPDLFNFFGVLPENVGAIADVRIQNTASTETNGIDWSAQYSKLIPVGLLSVGLSGAYIFSFDNQATDTSDPVELVDTVGNPIDLKLRGSLGLSTTRFDANLVVNYTDDYISQATGAEQPVDSWTTVDANFTLKLSEFSNSPVLSEAELSLAARNLFNEDPPFVDRTGIASRAFFDGLNANALKRFISISFKKSF